MQRKPLRRLKLLSSIRRYFNLRENDDVITAWISLDDADEGNGAMRLLERSHLDGIVPHGATDPAQ